MLINTFMLILDIIENIGKAPARVCRGSKPDSQLPASWVASCRSQGLRARDSDKEHTIKGKRTAIDNKKIKGEPYNGPLPNYSD